MTRKPHKRFWVLIPLALIGIVSLVVVFSPWKQWIGAELKRRLEAQGLQNVELTVSRVDPKSITLENLSVGKNPPLVLNNVTLDYSLGELLSGNVQSLTLEGLMLQVLRTEGVWGIGGLKPSSKGPLAIPVDRDDISSIPLGSAKIQNSSMRIRTDGWQMNLPLNIEWSKTPAPSVSYEGQGLDFRAKDITINAGNATAKALLEDGVWTGPWQITGIKVAGTPTPIPQLTANGRLKASADRVEVEGKIVSDDKSYKIGFQADYFLSASEKSKVEITEAEMPWNNGILSTRNVSLPLKSEAEIPFDLEVRHVSTDALLQQLTGKKASATGGLSGVLPVAWKKDGSFVVRGQGVLTSDGPGVINMAPDAIPGDNPQVALVREVLTEFHYSNLSIHIESDKENRLSMRMNLEGRNPNAQAGRPVKLSVNLGGDVLGFVQQNLMWLTDPRKFLEQGNDAKN